MLLVPIIGVLVIGVVNGFRNCNDCKNVTRCTEAYNRVHTDKSQATIDMLSTAQCGYMKVCCSDFSVRAPDEKIETEYEIENHPNAYLLPDDCGEIAGDRIIGGARAAMNEFPWLALIYNNRNKYNHFKSVGTVINERYVLVAANSINGINVDGVIIGEYNVGSRTDCTGLGIFRVCQSNLQDVGVSKKIVHPGYVRSPIVLNDIGLLRLKSSLKFNVANAASICLPVLRSLRYMNTAGTRGTVAGWGITENRTRSNVLLKVDVPIYEKNTCRIFYDRQRNLKTSTDRFGSAFCAGESQHGFCAGYAGGPLMIEAPYKNGSYKLIQFGIASYGPAQCGSEVPGVFTEVKEFIKWILDTIEP